MTPLADLERFLCQQQLAHAFVGALAMAIHGHASATHGLALLTVDRAVLENAFWSALKDSGWTAAIGLGEFDEAFAGIVALSSPGEELGVGIRVGRWGWQREIVEQAPTGSVLGVRIPVAGASDLVLLSLDAGAPTDLADARALVELAEDRDALERNVEARLVRLGPSARAAWREIVVAI